jgi:hypothetical protein
MKFPKPENEKELSDTTKKIYQRYLNKLFNEDIAVDVTTLLVHANTVCDFIDATAKDTREKRTWMSAIFWALHDIPLETKKKYYNYFQTLKVDSEGKPTNQKFI